MKMWKGRRDERENGEEWEFGFEGRRGAGRRGGRYGKDDEKGKRKV
jgi:hypothetical protein